MDDVQARSEARRRKILENAEARLKRISEANFGKREPRIADDCNLENVPEVGIPQAMSVANGGPSVSLARSESRENQTTETPTQDTAGVHERQQPEDFLTRLSAALNASEGTGNNNNSLGEPTNWWDFGLIILLGVVVRLLYNTKYSWLFTESMWVPFLSVAIPDLLLSLSRGPPPAGFLYSFVILCGIPPQRVAYFFYAATFIRRFLQFFSLYIFSFVMTHIVTGELMLNLA